jgi:type I restriction enzyme, S subunit
MRSNYKILGDYIRNLNLRNSSAEELPLLGINIDKFFMPSVANIVGTDLSTYKVVNFNQFACNRMHVGRDERLPVAISQSLKKFIVSPAYDVFEVIDPEALLPEYLMMWFSRKEYDRQAWFYTDADVRGGLHWDAFCDMKLPIPHPAKQKEIVNEYNTIVNRIKLNEQLIQKLEETAQAIYKQWFVL